LAWIKSVRVRHSEDGKAGVKKETERSRTQLVDLTVFIESPPCLMLIVHCLGEVVGPCFLVESYRETRIAGQGEKNHNIRGIGLVMEIFVMWISLKAGSDP
jgi:hypothetical protein